MLWSGKVFASLGKRGMEKADDVQRERLICCLDWCELHADVELDGRNASSCVSPSCSRRDEALSLLVVDRTMQRKSDVHKRRGVRLEGCKSLKAGGRSACLELRWQRAKLAAHWRGPWSSRLNHVSAISATRCYPA